MGKSFPGGSENEFKEDQAHHGNSELNIEHTPGCYWGWVH